MSGTSMAMVSMNDEVREYIKAQIAASLNAMPMEGFKLYAVDEQFIPDQPKLGDSGFDLRANIPSSITLRPGERALIPTGIHVEMPVGFEMQIRPRSGIARKQGGSVVNTPGTIDANYRGEVGVVFINTDKTETITILRGDRFAQAVICRVERINWQIVPTVESLESSERGANGFGSTGV